MITLRTLGECIVEVDGEPLGPDADTAFAALVLLAGERDRQLSRRRIAELFWPGVAESRARHSLRQLLYRLRAFDLELDAGREHVRLPAELIVPTFASEPTLERLREAQAAGTLVVGPCLPGYAPAFSPAFQEWLDEHRSVVEARVRGALLEAAREHQLRGEWLAAETLARECLRIDPLNETATRRRAECVAMMGGKAEALAILDRYNAEMGQHGAEVTLPTRVLRRNIAEQLPARRYAIPSDRCFVGREGLMSVLTLALLRAKNREGGSTLLWGPPGIGKTRVAQELSAVAAVEGLRIVRVQCEESDARQPMATWVDAVPQLLRLPGALGVSPDAMPFLKRLTEFDPTLREPSPEARDPQYLAGRIRQSIVDLVDAVSGESPLFLLFEDVHWMDGASWAGLRVLLEWNASKPVMILLTSRRPHPTPAPPQREVPRLELHEVRALDERAASQLVGAIAADFGGPMPEGAEAWCLTVGEGNPLFLRELVVDCLVEGQPRAVPPTVQTLLDARIARLRPGARQVLQACAILGEHATIERLEAVLQMPAYELVGALDELSEAGLLATGTPAVRPRHELVAARIAAATSEASRRLLHRRAAATLELEVERGAAIETMWACAAHWTTSGHPSRAMRLALSAVNQLIELGLPRDALEVCDAAAHMCRLPLERFDLLRLKVRALHLANEFHQALLSLRELTSNERDIVPMSTWASDVLTEIEVEAHIGGFAHAAATEAANFAANRNLDDETRLRSAQLALRIASNLDAGSIAQYAWEAVRPIAVAQDETSITALRVAMIYELTYGDIEQGRRAAHLLWRRIQAESTKYASIPILLNLVDANRICGDSASAIDCASLAFSASVRHGSKHTAVRAAQLAMEIAIDCGDAETAHHWFEELRPISAEANDLGAIISNVHLSARLLLLDGDPAGAFATASALLADGRRTGSLTPWWKLDLLTTIVESHLADSTSPVDHHLLQELIEEHRAARRRPLQDRATRIVRAALIRAGRTDAAEEVLREYLDNRRGEPGSLHPELRRDV